MRLAAVALCLLLALAGCFGVAPGPDAPAPGGGTDDGADGGPNGRSPALGANGTLSVHFINVGQSASALVISPTGETMLVDSGDYGDDGEHVVRYLERRGVDRVDHLVTSHADADHIGGHAAVIEHFETEGEGVGAVYDPGIASSTRTYEEYLDAVERHDVPLYRTVAGDSIPLDGASVRVLAPPDGYLADRERNENSLVLYLRFGETAVLLPGDAEASAERYVVNRSGGSIPATVLSAGHHGSASSTGEALLDATDPKIAVVSSAFDSRYGHPHEETLRRLAARDVRTYWTATHGDVAVVSDGDRASVYTQRAAPTDPLALREGDPVAPGTDDALERRAVVDGDVVDGRSGTDRTESPPALVVAEVHADAAGDDRRNLNDEYVVFENAGDAPLDVSGWTVRDEAGKTYAVPEGVVLDPGERVTLRTGDADGGRDGTDLHWGAGGPVWNNDGDTVVVENDNGDRILTETYA
ncbi:lamin tail domain-containing protein [Halomarina pelagica]|uniref:lamin tail domain-containing protein n=1 Tax=Halomarina pelagica TaxID=2961599 RepID=UPI0020C473A1|nr:lamin tail domain-containing protein [Halomarina sp. BND7]